MQGNKKYSPYMEGRKGINRNYPCETQDYWTYKAKF